MVTTLTEGLLQAGNETAKQDLFTVGMFDGPQRFTPNLTCPASRSVAIQGSRQDGVKASNGSTGMERAPATVQEAKNCYWPILHDICRLTGFGYAGNLAVNQL